MIQQKRKESVLPTKRCFAFAFVSASLLNFWNFWNYLITTSLFVREAKFKRAPFVFEGGHIVIIRGNLFFNFHGVHNGLYINL